MNTRKVSDWAEILASLAVLFSLVFLIVEVRAQTRAIERQAGHERARNYAEPFLEAELLIGASGKVRAVDGENPTRNGLQEAYGMTGPEAEAWSRHLLQIWMGLQADYLYGNREVALGVAESLLRFPDQQLYMRSVRGRGLFDPEFEAGLTPILPPEVLQESGAGS